MQNKDMHTKVGCCVSACTYNTETNCCCAQHIDVKNERAESEAETFCSTFSPKGRIM